MTLTLLVLAMIVAANPFRAAAARPIDAARETGLVAIGASLVLVWISGVASGPLLDLVDVSGPSARIAAGVALLVVALKDVFMTPPTAEPTRRGWQAGVVPLAFPVVFSPTLALLAVAGAAERGVAVALLAGAIALLPTLVALEVNTSWPTRPGAAVLGALGTGLAALVVLDGVYAI